MTSSCDGVVAVNDHMRGPSAFRVYPCDQSRMSVGVRNAATFNSLSAYVTAQTSMNRVL